MWNTSKLTFKEFEMIRDLKNVINKMEIIQEQENLENFFLEKDVTLNLMSDVVIDINHDELYLCIQRFLNGETKAVALEASQNTGFHVVEILQHHYDYVFGYIENEDGKTFYLSETHDNWSEACEEGHYFTIDDGETVIGLHDCVRFGTYI